MFDISWTELLVIVVVAVVVVGPKDLPRLMRTAGQWAGRARAMADQFRRSFDDMARQTELDELRREVQKLQAQQPMTAKDYEAFGIREEDFGNAAELTAKIEDVGAAPPKLDAPVVVKPVVDTSAGLADTATSAPTAAPSAPTTQQV